MPETSRSPIGRAIPVSVIVLTLNEERHIRACLESLAWCNDIWVLDSFSNDATLKICEELTPNIQQRVFANYSDPRNWGLQHLPLKYEWGFFVDADERVTPELRDEILSLVADTNRTVNGYYIPRKQYYWGKWLRHGECWPGYVMRLFKRRKGRFTNREVHEAARIEGQVEFAKHHLIHISVESMTEFLEKFNHFTTLDAQRMFRTGQELYAPESHSYSAMRDLYKRILRYLPCKPLLKFMWDYVAKQGFRDGHIGFVWAFWQGVYVFVAYFKLWELRRGIVREDP